MFRGRVVAGSHLGHSKAPGLSHAQCSLRVIVVKIGCFTSGVLVPNRRLRHGALVAFDVPFVPGMDTELERDVIPDFGVWSPERQRPARLTDVTRAHTVTPGSAHLAGTTCKH